MSHDLKTPITRLRLRTELLADPGLREKFTRDLEEMETLVKATLDFLRGFEGGEASKPVDMMALLESLQADLSELGGQVRLEGQSLKPYYGKPAALKRCLANLLDNAIKYGKSATAKIDDDDRRLEIRIQDEGPGIPASDIDRVFEPYYRLDASRSRDTGGTGLGLAIAKSIARAHGGELTLENRREGGLEAKLILPRSEAAPTKYPILK
jgi:signal transduction histidine kinase